MRLNNDSVSLELAVIMIRVEDLFAEVLDGLHVDVSSHNHMSLVSMVIFKLLVNRPHLVKLEQVTSLLWNDGNSNHHQKNGTGLTERVMSIDVSVPHSKNGDDDVVKPMVKFKRGVRIGKVLFIVDIANLCVVIIDLINYLYNVCPILSFNEDS